MPLAPGLCWASLRIGSSHGGWAGLGGHHPYLPSMDALSFHAVCCAPHVPRRGARVTAAAPTVATHPLSPPSRSQLPDQDH